MAIVPGAVACVFLAAVLVGQGLSQAGLWATVLGVPVGLVGAGAALWGVLGPPARVPVPPELTVPDWVIDRPDEVSEVVTALLDGQGRTVGITTALLGAGGFGKTVLARVICADPRVRRWFRGYVYLVTMGRDVRGAAAVAAKVNDVIKLMTGEDATFTDPELAGQWLGSLLETGPRRLLVLDDVWWPEQLTPFTDSGRRCARLVTTRVPGLLAGRGVAVRVDQMSLEQARLLLTSGLPPLDAAVTGSLLAVTGRWPLLLRLVSKILANAVQAGSDVTAAGRDLVTRLQAGGPAVVDDLSGEPGGTLDVGQPRERERAVRATIGASTSLLDPDDAQRLAELGVFAEDEAIPFSLAARLWRATAGLDELQASQLCVRLGELALVSRADTGALTMHDVVRDFLRSELGLRRLAGLNDTLVEAGAAGLPGADPLAGPALPTARVAWWELGSGERYLWDHLIEHLRDAGRRAEAEAVAGDLRWAGARLEKFGPAAPAADLALAGTPRTAMLRATLERTVHLLAPTEPAQAVTDILHSRLADDAGWGPQVRALRQRCDRPRLVNRWPLPDLPDLALRRVLTGHRGPVLAVAIAPGASWLATGSADGTVRIWDTATGEEQAAFAGHDGPVLAVAIAPGGNWLASGGHDRTVRLWDPATGRTLATLPGHEGPVETVAIAPDASWLAAGSADGTVRIWDPATARRRPGLLRHRGAVQAVAIAADGSWLATGSEDHTVRIWDARKKEELVTARGHHGTVNAVAIAPDGSWLATASSRTVRAWERSTGAERATLKGHDDTVHAVAIAPGGGWLATGSDSTVRIWDAATGLIRATMEGHRGPVNAVAIAPDGSWLATGSDDRTVRIWNAADGQDRPARATPQGAVRAIAAAPDGSWLATSGSQAVRIWDAATRQQRAILGHSRQVQRMAIAPDGSWLVTIVNRTVRIWDAATGEERAALRHVLPVNAVAIAPDSSWLASGSDDGTVRILDAATGEDRTGPLRHDRAVSAVAIAPDGSWLVTAARAVRVWDAGTGLARAAPARLDWAVRGLAISPDGDWLATVTPDGAVRIWDPATVRARVTLNSPGGPGRTLAVAPDGSWLGYGDQTVRIWDTATWQERGELYGHRGQVNAMAAAPGSSWLATGGQDRTLRVWDTSTGEALAVMRAENAIDTCAWIGPTGLAAGGPGGLYLFDFLPYPRLPGPGTGLAGHQQPAG